MRKETVIRAWKDVAFRSSLSATDRALVPAHPAGVIDLSDDQLELVVGGLAAQTGTGSPNCVCLRTITAQSGGGTCNCVCPEPAPTPTPAPETGHF
jgi:mersacidin/lichenicidin family type 2 lantibiotic